jgi:O-Antigen ligase
MQLLATKNNEPPLLGWWLWLGLLSISPVWSKFTGACWLVGVLMALWVWKTRPVLPDLVEATQKWRVPLLVLTFLPLVLRITPHVYWSDSWSERHYDLRMAALGLAIYVLVVRVRLQTHHVRQLIVALSLACIAAAVHAFIYRREATSNPIPWATAIGMMPFLLFAMIAILRQSSASLASIDVWIRRFALWSAGAAMIAVWLSGTRSALFSILLVALFAIWYLIMLLRNTTRISATKKSLPLRIAFAGVFFSAATAFVVHNPSLYLEPASRIHMAWVEAKQYFAANQHATDAAHYSNPVGSRLKLYELSLKEIAQNPWLGLGKQERLKTLAFWMRNTSSPEVKVLGHNQNEYLHAAMDQGIFGLGAIVSGILAFGWLSWVLIQQRNPIGWGIGACVLVWLTGGLFNVNTAHNFMSNMFGNLMLASLWLATIPNERQN